MAEITGATAYVFDTWSIMAYLTGEVAGEQCEKLIAESHRDTIPLFMSVVNAAEVWYTFARRTSEAKAHQSLVEVSQLGIRFQDVDMELAVVAARFKSQNKMSLADCFAAALAVRVNGHLVTGDNEFRQVANDVKLFWLQPK